MKTNYLVWEKYIPHLLLILTFINTNHFTSLDFFFSWLTHYWLFMYPTSLRLPVPVPSLYRAHPGMKRIEERASPHPNTWAQFGYMYDRLKVRGWYQTKEHIKQVWKKRHLIILVLNNSNAETNKSRINSNTPVTTGEWGNTSRV